MEVIFNKNSTNKKISVDGIIKYINKIGELNSYLVPVFDEKIERIKNETVEKNKNMVRISKLVKKNYNILSKLKVEVEKEKLKEKIIYTLTKIVSDKRLVGRTKTEILKLLTDFETYDVKLLEQQFQKLKKIEKTL